MKRSSFARPAGLMLVLALIGGLPATAASADADAPVVVIAMENHAYGPTDPGVNGDTAKYIVGNTADAPYLNGTLIPSGTLFTNDDSNYHPSLPDYLEMTAGTEAGCKVDSCARDAIANDNLFHQLGGAGTSFVSLAESMPANCTLANTGTYLVRHNPETYYTDVDAASGVPYGCATTDVAIAPASTPGAPLAWPDPLPAFTFVAPDLCHDMHGSTATGVCPKDTDQIVADGDAWLAANVPALLAEGAVVLVTWDEGASGDTTGGGGHVATIMAGPGVAAGTTDATPYSHASLMAGLQDYFNLGPLLAEAASATPLPIPRTTPYAVPVISGLSPETGSPGDPVTIAGTGFTNAYSVRFDGTPAAFTVDSDTSITAAVPAGALPGSVTVSAMGGTATSPDLFTPPPPPPPPPGPALVQQAAGSGVMTTQALVAWPQTTADGDLLVATLGWSGTAKVTAPAGWALAVSSNGTAIYFREGAPASSESPTFSLSRKANWVLSVSEWSGIATSGAFDQKAHASGSVAGGTNASSGITRPTKQAVELAIAGIRAQATLTEADPKNGFIQLEQLSAGTNDTLGVYDVVSSTVGVLSTAVTISAHANWHGAIATFRSA